MANRFYAKGVEAFASAGISFTADTQKAALVSSASYTPNFSSDQYFNVIPGGAVIAAGVALSSKTATAGVLSATNTIWTAVSGSQAAYIILYKDTGVSSTSPLWGYIDTATGLPVTPNGGDITAAWSGGQIATLMAGLPERERSLIRAIREWMNDALGLPAKLGPGGIWLPSPRIARTNVLA